MKKLLMVLADGFEDTEALTTRDVLIRGGIIVTTISIKSDPLVRTSFGLIIRCDAIINNINIDEYDGIILPGGKLGVDNLLLSPYLKDILIKYNNEKKLICAICAAPSILGKYNLLVNRNFTCYKGFEFGYEGNFVNSEVEVSENIITARSMYYSQDFALAIIKYFHGEEIKEKIYKQVCSL